MVKEMRKMLNKTKMKTLARQLPENDQVEEYSPDECSMADNSYCRYLIVAAHREIWCDNYKIGPCGSIDTIQIQKVGGEHRIVYCSIFEQSYIIYDFETEITHKVFAEIKERNVNSLTNTGKDVLEESDAVPGINKKSNPLDTSIMSAYA